MLWRWEGLVRFKQLMDRSAKAETGGEGRLRNASQANIWDTIERFSSMEIT